MLESYLSTLFLISNIFGYSALCKYILNRSNKVCNIDFIYGIFFAVVLSLLLNLFLPLRYFSIIFLFFGFLLFFIFLVLKHFQLNFYLLSLITFFVVFISHQQSITYDSQLYHLQVLQLSHNYKAIFGIGNLQPHYAMNSSWHSLLSIIDIKLFNINFIYLANLSLFIIFISEALIKNLKQVKKLSNIFLTLTILYILMYSFFHPYGNGTILNLLGSPEADFPAALFFILIIYLFISYYEKHEKEILWLILLTSFILITTKISYLGSFLFIIYSILLCRKNFIIFEKINLALMFACILWLIKGFISSGCFIFPISFTCVTTSWSMNIDEVQSYSNIVQSFARDTPLRINFTNFDYTLYSFDWFKPWVKEYFFKTELLFVSFAFILLSILYLIFKFIKLNLKLGNIFKNFYLHLIFLIFFNLFIWMKAPEIRFGYGSIISLSCILLSLVIYDIFQKYLEQKKLINFIIVIFFIPIFIKNLDNKNNINKISFVRNFDYSNFEKIYEVNNYVVFKPTQNNFCNKFQGFCTYQGFRVNIVESNSYLFMNKNK